MSQIELLGITVALHCVRVLGAWVRLRVCVQLEQARADAQVSLVRVLPPGSRIIEQHGQSTMIEISPTAGTGSREVACG